MSRRVPTPRGEERLFFDSAAAGTLVYQECLDCGARHGQPRTVCSACLSEDLVVVPCVGLGTVYSYTVVHRAGHPSFADRVPYAVVLVDLDEGVRVLADLVDRDLAELAVGSRVQALFEEKVDALVLPQFRLVRSQAVLA